MNDRVKQVAGTLIIREAKVEDSGKYLCVVNNSVGGESVETVLTVTAPLKASIDPPVQTIDFGRPAVFTCKYEGMLSHSCYVERKMHCIKFVGRKSNQDPQLVKGRK